MGSKAALGSSRLDFGSILRGLGGVWGGFWDRFEGQNWIKLREKKRRVTNSSGRKCFSHLLSLALSILARF